MRDYRFPPFKVVLEPFKVNEPGAKALPPAHTAFNIKMEEMNEHHNLPITEGN